MAATGHDSSISAVGARSQAPARSSGDPVTPERDFADTIATFHLDDFEGAADPSLSQATRHAFTADFYRELAQLSRWAAARNWPPCGARELQVIVSGRFRISKSLVPAWHGHAGRMEFPAWRVVARKAAIAHELAHVFFPNGNRLLAEGLAVHLQAEIGGNPAFPNFGRPLHELARERLLEMVSEIALGDPRSLEKIDLAELDAIATPRPLELRVGQNFYGEDARGQAHIYPIAGSFVQFLIDSRGLEKFRTLYLRTPLVALEHNAGSPDRWAHVYDLSLAALADEWKSMIVGSGKTVSQQLQSYFNREHSDA